MITPTRITVVLALCLFGLPSYGQSRNTVKIGNQEWMAENLNENTFRNGDLIPEATTDKDWNRYGKNRKPAWRWFPHLNDYENVQKYGKLYNWYAVNDPRGLAPEGWHIPNKEEFEALLNQLGGQGKNGYRFPKCVNS